MVNYYITYGFNTNLADKFSIVQGESPADARAAAVAVTKGHFAFMYTAEEFAGQQEQFGLAEAPLQAQVLVPHDA